MKRFTLSLVLAGALLASFAVGRASAMSKASMQALAAALTNAGYPAKLILNQDGSWTVRSQTSDGFTVNVNAVKALADAQGVGAFVSEVEYR